VNKNYSDWKGWYEEDFGKFSTRESRYFSYQLKRAFPNRHEKLSILEIGFGNGAFMGWAKSVNYQIIGVEENFVLTEYAEKKGFVTYNNLNLVEKNYKFDLIVGFDVLEHIDTEDLIEFLLTLKSKLSKKGRMIFRFPNAESPLGLVYQNGDITHKNFLGVSKIFQLCKIIDLEIVCSGARLPWYERKIRSRFTALLATVIRLILEYLVGHLYVGKRISLEPNELVILRLKNDLT